jgi:hypothetical protein
MKKTMADLIQTLYYLPNLPESRVTKADQKVPLTRLQVIVLAREFAVGRSRGTSDVGDILTFADGSYTHTQGAAKFTAGCPERDHRLRVAEIEQAWKAQHEKELDADEEFHRNHDGADQS